MDNPQHNSNATEENRRTIVTIGHRWRHGRVNRPNKGACERERVRQWIAGDIGNRFLHVKVFTADRHCHADGGYDCTRQRFGDRAAFMRHGGGHQYQQRRPQIIDEADFHRLRVRCGQTDRQRDRRLVCDEHESACDEVLAWRLVNRFRPSHDEQEHAADSVDERRAERGAERFGNESHEAGHEAPQDDCEQADECRRV